MREKGPWVFTKQVIRDLVLWCIVIQQINLLQRGENLLIEICNFSEFTFLRNSYYHNKDESLLRRGYQVNPYRKWLQPNWRYNMQRQVKTRLIHFVWRGIDLYFNQLPCIEKIGGLPQKTFTHFKGHLCQKKVSVNIFHIYIIIKDFSIWLIFIWISICLGCEFTVSMGHSVCRIFFSYVYCWIYRLLVLVLDDANV